MSSATDKLPPVDGSLSALVGTEPQRPVYPIGSAGWVKLAVVGALFLVLHAWQMPNLYTKWQDPNWQHGWAIPFFTLYLLIMRRHEILALPRTGGNLGLGLVLSGLILELVGVWLA